MNHLFVVILLFAVICGTSAQTKIPTVVGIDTHTYNGIKYYTYYSFVRGNEDGQKYALFTSYLKLVGNYDGKIKFRTTPYGSTVFTKPVYIEDGSTTPLTVEDDEFEFELTGSFGPEYDKMEESLGRHFLTLSDTQEARQQYVDVDIMMSQKLQRSFDHKPICFVEQQTPIKAVAITLDDIPELFTDISIDEYQAPEFRTNTIRATLSDLILDHYSISNYLVIKPEISRKAHFGMIHMYLPPITRECADRDWVQSFIKQYQSDMAKYQ
jgi:hypothetical protein